jgi:hypothetical protein
MFPQCYTEDWSSLKGETCESAKASILAKFPGMTIVCLSSSDAMPTEDDLARYVIVTDATTGLVTQVALNRNAKCPTSETFKTDKSCSVFGQKCEFTHTEEPNKFNDACTFTEFGTCQFGTFSVLEAFIECEQVMIPDIVTILPPPVTKPPPADDRGCPLEGFGFEIFNDPACPATWDLGSACTIDGLHCNYGKEEW